MSMTLSALRAPKLALGAVLLAGGLGLLAPRDAEAYPWRAWGPGVVVGVPVYRPPVVIAPPVAYAPPPVPYNYYRRPVWIRPHWWHGYWVRGHWARGPWR